MALIKDVLAIITCYISVFWIINATIFNLIMHHIIKLRDILIAAYPSVSKVQYTSCDGTTALRLWFDLVDLMLNVPFNIMSIFFRGN